MPTQNENGENLFTQEELNTIIGQRLAKYADYDAVKAELEAVKANQQTVVDEAVNEAVATAKTELNQQWGQKFVGLKAQAIAAAEGFQDPEDAGRFMDLTDVSFNEETGELDEEAITTKVKETAEAKPYLLRARKNNALQNVGLGTQGKETKDAAAAFAGMEGLSF